MGALLQETLTTHDFEVDRATDVIEARESIRAFDPDAVLLDIGLGDGPSGLDLARSLTIQRPDIAVVFLTNYPDPRATGADPSSLPPGCGYLRKDRVHDSAYLVASIESVLAECAAQARHDLTEAQPLGDLSARQLEALRLIAAGYTNEHIAHLKGVAISTVERWSAEIFRTLGIHSDGELNPRVEAARRFIAAAGLPVRS